jgi:N-acetylglutamate synthase-like GNAT family acetyltransferase
MNIRQATDGDTDRIREIAEQSFQASYALSPLDIESIVEIEFSSDPLTPRLEDENWLLLVAEDDDSILGFIEGQIIDGDTGEIRWLHVSPTDRGQGVGTKLFEQMLADLRERAVETIQAVVLADNQEGGEFFEQFAFESHDQKDREFDERTLNVEVFRSEETTTDEDEEDEEQYTVPEGEQISVEGETRYLDTQESISGDEGEFLFVFEESDLAEHFGFYCTNCGTFTDSVDGQGTVICEECGNEHRPEEWDGSYL